MLYEVITSKKDEITRQSTAIEKTGVFTGSYAINPVNNEKVPIYVFRIVSFFAEQFRFKVIVNIRAWTTQKQSKIN